MGRDQTKEAAGDRRKVRLDKKRRNGREREEEEKRKRKKKEGLDGEGEKAQPEAKGLSFREDKKGGVTRAVDRYGIYDTVIYGDLIQVLANNHTQWQQDNTVPGRSITVMTAESAAILDS